MVRVVVCRGRGEVAATVADAVAARVTGASAVLGLATGASMVPVYDELAGRCRRGPVSFLTTTPFLPDDYLGIAANDPRRFANVIRRVFADRVDIDPGRLHTPGSGRDGLSGYEALIERAGGVDLQLLGIGRNGHIAFNEPGAPFSSR